MATKHLTNDTNDLGRELTADVATLALTLPVVAREAFSQVVLPFVFVASLVLVVLFVTPFRDVPFVGQQATAQLVVMRSLLMVGAFALLAFPGYAEIEALSARWLVAAGIAVLGLTVISIDLRRIFPA